MAILKRAVFVRDPVKHRDVLLRPGEEPAPELAAQVTNSACWEDGVAPDQDANENSDTSDASNDGAKTETKQAAPAAKKTAAKKAAAAPARGRSAADKGTSGD